MGPQRIVCLTEEPTETLYLLGEQQRIVGISGFTVRPPVARREKPKVSAFLSAKIDRILDLKPDLAIGFSDIQADIARELIGAGVEVWIANHRSVDGILDYIRRLAALVGRAADGMAMAQSMADRLDVIAGESSGKSRPKVYFEEWDEPRIPAIQWVAELIRIAGGDDLFPDRAECSLARDRILPDDSGILSRRPDIVIGSWCGKKFQPRTVAQRTGWSELPAVRDDELHEIKSPLILQPGPAALTDGLDALVRIVRDWQAQRRGGSSG